VSLWVVVLFGLSGILDRWLWSFWVEFSAPRRVVFLLWLVLVRRWFVFLLSLLVLLRRIQGVSVLILLALMSVLSLPLWLVTFVMNPPWLRPLKWTHWPLWSRWSSAGGIANVGRCLHLWTPWLRDGRVGDVGCLPLGLWGHFLSLPVGLAVFFLF